MAGALGFALGGPRAYDGEMRDLPLMGSGRAELNSADIRKALELYGTMLNIARTLAPFASTKGRTSSKAAMKTAGLAAAPLGSHLGYGSPFLQSARTTGSFALLSKVR